MYVCVCNAVTDRDIREVARKGVCSMQGLSDALKVATCCGRCSECARQILHQSMTQNAQAPIAITNGA